MFKRTNNLAAKLAATLAFGCAAVCALAVAAPVLAYADDYASKMAEAEAALQSLNNMLVEVDQANADYNAALEAQDEAEQKVVEAQATIDEKTAQIKDNQGKLSTRVRSLYRMGDASFLEVLFGSSTFDEFANNLDLLNDMNDNDAQLVASIKEDRAAIEKAKIDLEEQSALAKQKSEEAAAKRDEANAMAAELQASYENLSAEANALLAAQEVTPVQEATVSQDEIVAFEVDEATGYGIATLSDGTQARVVGYDSETGNAIVDLAMSFVGGNYAWGAEDASTSTFDCSGLVQYVYAQNGISVGGHNDRAILNAGTVIDASEAEAGDILWWDGHVAIYAGDGMMVSADNEEYGITYREVSDGATYVTYG